MHSEKSVTGSKWIFGNSTRWSELIFIAAVLVLGVVAARGEFSRQTVYVLVEGFDRRDGSWSVCAQWEFPSWKDVLGEY